MTLTHVCYTQLSRMAQFIQDSSTGSSDSSSSSSSGSESDLDFDVVRPKAVKFNEAGPEAQSSITEKEKKTTAKATGKNRQTNTEKTQEVQKEKLAPERTIRMVRKIIGNYKKRATKDKKKLNKLLRSATATARKYKLFLNKFEKKSA